MLRLLPIKEPVSTVRSWPRAVNIRLLRSRLSRCGTATGKWLAIRQKSRLHTRQNKALLRLVHIDFVVFAAIINGSHEFSTTYGPVKLQLDERFKLDIFRQ